MFSRVVYAVVSCLPNRLVYALPERVFEVLMWAGSEAAERADERNSLRVVQ